MVQATVSLPEASLPEASLPQASFPENLLPAPVLPAPSQEVHYVRKSLVERVLRPYRPQCQYLLDAQLSMSVGENQTSLPAVTGRFSIPASFYIDDTGHFNAVEFILCFNQLGYVCIATCIESKRDSTLGQLSLDRFFELQLGDILILDVDVSFRKLMNARAFSAEISWETRRVISGLCVGRMKARFFDDQGGVCRGTVLIGIRGPEFKP